MGTEMSDEVLRSYKEPVKETPAPVRGTTSIFPRLAMLFIEDKQQIEQIHWEKMAGDRTWGAVAQGLRIALKKTQGANGEPLSTIAYVSVDKGKQTIYLRRRSAEGPVGPGRPKKSTD